MWTKDIAQAQVCYPELSQRQDSEGTHWRSCQGYECNPSQCLEQQFLENIESRDVVYSPEGFKLI